MHDIKGTLAKLLATENLTVEHIKCETASFDVKNRVLSLPLWIASESVYDMLVGHEVGHALYTPAEGWEGMTDVPKSYVNILEDVRIEKAMKEKFPGLRKDFFAGYRELNDKDFFGVESLDLPRLKLIDRINLHYKVGVVDHTKPIPFSEDEQDWVAEADTCNSFEDVIALAQRIYEWQGEKDMQEEMEDMPAKSEAEGNDSESFDTIQTESDAKPDDKQDGNMPQPQNSQEKGDADEELEDLDEGNFDRQGGFDYNEGVTDKNFAENLQELAEDMPEYHHPSYADVPELNLKNITIHHDVWIKDLEDFWNSPCYTDPNVEHYVGIDFSEVDKDYAKFRKQVNQEVNYMVKEFECKKSAAAYARASVSKTGVLDTTKLFTYKYNDDIFKKITITPDGKNHGLIFLLDWSGSMSGEMHQTVKQLLSLALFCRKAKIPFVAHAFSDQYWSYHGDYEFKSSEQDFSAYKNGKGNEGEFAIYPHLRLIQFLTSDSNNQEFDKCMHYLYRLGAHFQNRYNYWGYNFPIAPCLGLGGTPLNDTLVAVRTMIPDFKKKYNVEKLHVVTLTDGESNSIGVLQRPRFEGQQAELFRGGLRGRCVVRDKKIGYHGKMTDNCHGALTKGILEYLKYAFPTTNFVGFRIISGQDAGHFLRWGCGREYQQEDPILKTWKKQKSICLPNTNGYQELYLINKTNLNQDSEFEVKQDATNAQIRTAFKKSLGAKSNNKKILSSFIAQIA
jgi:hypothetical protein|tara:strand:+ start:945 stop:3143 length:2199 start_codon:yes stop_codon:yes gene_type:complete